MDRLRLVDFSDRELLALVLDNADDDGWITAEEFSLLPELSDLGKAHKYPARHVGSRFAWLHKWGVLEREQVRNLRGELQYVNGDAAKPRYSRRWKVSLAGESLVRGELTEAQRRQLEIMDPSRMVHLTRWMTERAQGSPEIAKRLMLREWRYGTAKERFGG